MPHIKCYFDESSDLRARLTQAIAERDINQREIDELSSQLTKKKEETLRLEGYIDALQQMIPEKRSQSHRPHQHGVSEWYNPNHSQNSSRHHQSQKSAEETPMETPNEDPDFNEFVKKSVIEIMKDKPEIKYLLSSLGIKLKKEPYSLTFERRQLVNILKGFKDDFIVCCASDENSGINPGQDYVELNSAEK